MALVTADRVYETTTTTGTGTVTLAGAVSGYQSFATIGNGNTTYYTITSGTAWEVGIGTYTSSGTTLARTTIIASSAAGAAITLTGTSNVFVTYPAEKAVIQNASGDVGVGTTAPASKLDVRNGDITVSRTASATAGDAAVYFGNGNTAYVFAGNTSNIMAFAVNSSERMRIDASGNVGIGSTPSGTYKLEVNGSMKTQGDFVLSSSTGSKIYPYYGSSTNNNYITAGSGGEMKFGTGTSSPADRMTISAAGGVSIGTTTDPGATNLLVGGTLSGTIKSYKEFVTAASSSTAYAVDLSTANIFNITMTGNCTFTFTNPPASGTSYSFTLILKQDATGSRTGTWPASVKWPNASTPTLSTGATKTDILNFITVDGGTTYYGALSLANM
jgi:hypothetical protein